MDLLHILLLTIISIKSVIITYHIITDKRRQEQIDKRFRLIEHKISDL
jgi:hypothetical protein